MASHALASVLLATALAYHEIGIATRPCNPKNPREKYPVGQVGWQATRPSPDELRAMQWSTGIGIVTEPSGLVVVDLDSSAAQAWAVANLPSTPVRVRTGLKDPTTGWRGEHWYYAADPEAPIGCRARLHTGTGRLALDVRGTGGFAVTAPSLHFSGVSYESIGASLLEVGVAGLPIFRADWLGSKPTRTAGAAPTRARQDATEDQFIVRRARKYLESMGPAIEGQGGDAHTLDAACQLVRGFSLTDQVALELLTDWNQQCRPPWNLDDLRAKIQNAHNYGTQPYGGNIPDLAFARGLVAHARGEEGDAAGATPEPRRDASDLPRIIVRRGRLHEAVAEAEAALLEKHGGLYQRDGRLEVVDHVPRPGDKEDETPEIRQVTPERLLLLLSSCARFVRLKKLQDGTYTDVAIDPPKDLVKALLHKGHWTFPVLLGVSRVPVLRPDLSILDEDGYDDASGIVLHTGTTTFPSIELAPSKKDAQEALALVEDVICDFPFVDGTDKAVAVASIITAVVRHSIRGPTPMFLFTATAPGTGKSLLVTVASLIAWGRAAAPMAPVGNEELEKRITAMLLAGVHACVFDNIAGKFGGPALDAALTSWIWSGRVLGRSEHVELHNTATYFATANEPEIVGDLVRRTLRCRLDAGVERPERRSDFRHSSLRECVMEQRPQLVVAVLTMVRAYAVSGCQLSGDQLLGGFEEWCRVVRGPLLWLGLADPVASQDALREDGNEELAAWGSTLALLYQVFGEQCFLAADLIQGGTHHAERAALRAAIAEQIDTEDRSTRRIAGLLRRWRGRIVGGLRLERRGDKRTNKGWRWAVASVAAS